MRRDVLAILNGHARAPLARPERHLESLRAKMGGAVHWPRRWKLAEGPGWRWPWGSGRRRLAQALCQAQTAHKSGQAAAALRRTCSWGPVGKLKNARLALDAGAEGADDYDYDRMAITNGKIDDAQRARANVPGRAHRGARGRIGAIQRAPLLRDNQALRLI